MKHAKVFVTLEETSFSTGQVYPTKTAI